MWNYNAIRKMIALGAAMVPLMSCATDKGWKSTKVQSQDEVGEVLLTVTSTIPWSQIAEGMSRPMLK